MKIGNIEVGKVFLAPMAGVTDTPFRILCREYGASLACSEMISAKALTFDDKKTFSLMNFEGEKAPHVIQLFGHEPKVIAEAVKVVSQYADIIDINMGCPAPKITGNGEGSALMKSPFLAGEIIKAAVSNTDRPVTVKIRRGWETDTALEMAVVAERSGAAAITVHGRYAKQLYSGCADLAVIKRVKECVGIPVVGNGDIFDAESAANMLCETGCDAIMVGRGAMGNPFIFREINEYFKCGSVKTPLTLEERINTAVRHIQMLTEYKGERIGILEARKHVSWYVKGLRGASKIKEAANKAVSYEEMKEILLECLNEGESNDE